ncbi:MAG: aminotransferase class I/II-fold pyridoxal phosphate-dependent enzyme [Chlamydiota bacterium]
MSYTKINLASDNWSPAHPTVVQAVVEANQGAVMAYGADPWTHAAQECIQEVFQRPCKIFMIPTGTGSNVLALKLACRRHESVICTDIAHIHYQESGAAESVIGCKLLTVPQHKGKLTPDAVTRILRSERAFGKHSTSPRVLSITQPTEVGTVYSRSELEALSQLCKQENLLLHIDGSRLYNAAASMNIGLDEIVKVSQVDILSLGGTKNGLMGAEALLIFNPALEEGSDHLHKQTLQLLSKMRYLSAQYIPFFKENLWKDLAQKANRQAHAIAQIISATPHLTLSCPVETNQVFFAAPASWIPFIQDKIFCHLWDREKNELRFVASWNTTDQEVEELRSVLAEVAKKMS